MIGYIWGFMIVSGVLYGAFSGGNAMGLVASEAISSAKEAVELGMVMLGVVGMWNGIMNIAQESGLVSKWTKAIDPAISFLFPRIPKDDPVRWDIATNMIANILGLGWAATPAGLRAMKGLQRLENIRLGVKHTARASYEMCTLLVINISSLQLIPVNIIAYRTEYGSASPAAIVGPGILATALSTVVAVIFCKLMTMKREG